MASTDRTQLLMQKIEEMQRERREIQQTEGAPSGTPRRPLTPCSRSPTLATTPCSPIWPAAEDLSQRVGPDISWVYRDQDKEETYDSS